MKSFTLYRNNARQNERNNKYPIECRINSVEDLKVVALYDHIPCKCKNGIRQKENFISSDVIIMDLDNGHTDDPEGWKSLDDIAEVFEDVEFYYIESKSHMKVKDGKEARPKYHIYFPIESVDDPERFRQLKGYIGGLFPFFDQKCIDVTHFFYAVPEAKGGFYS